MFHSHFERKYDKVLIFNIVHFVEISASSNQRCTLIISALHRFQIRLALRALIRGNMHCVKSVKIRSFSGPYFPVFSLNTGKYGPEKTPYLDTFHAVTIPKYCGRP